MIKNNYFRNKLRLLKQAFLSLNKGPDEKTLLQQQKFISDAEEASKSKTAYFLQSRMDIDPYSCWHNPEFIK